MEVAVKANRSPAFRSALPGATRVKLTALNPHLICVLCGGYYIDATTIIECLHSFCRTCIIRYLDTSKYCPICEVQVHKTRPLHHIRQDKTLQDLVYKLVPGLFKEEMKRRRDYFTITPNDGSSTSQCLTAEGRGEVSGLHDRIIYTEDEKISLSLELSPNGRPPDDYRKRKAYGEFRNRNRRLAETDSSDRRFLLCPAAVTIAHLKKFIRMKFSLSDRYLMDVFHTDENLNDLYTLMDIAYIYRWKRRGPLRLFYTVYEFPAKKRRLVSTDTDLSKETSKEEEEETVTSVSIIVNGVTQPIETNVTEPMDLVKKSPEHLQKSLSPVPESQTNGTVSDCVPTPSPKLIDNNNTIRPASAAHSPLPREEILTKTESPPTLANNNNNNNNNNIPENLTTVETVKETVLDAPPKLNSTPVPPLTPLTVFQESVDENRPINMVMTSAVKKEPMELEETPTTS